MSDLSGQSLPRVWADDSAIIEIRINNSEPIDLVDFTASLTALAREHEAAMRDDRPGIDVDETRLLVVDIRKGSVVLELLPALAPIISSMEVTNTAVRFVEHMKQLYDQLLEPGGRVADATTQQLSNLNNSVHMIARDADSDLTISARYTNGEVLQEMVVRSEEAKAIVSNSLDQKREAETGQHAQYERALMRLHQSSVADVKTGRRTTEKGIVESIDPTPRVLIYASDLAGGAIKSEIQDGDGNPYQKGFVVDLDVETVGGKPRVYRITAVHDVVDLGGDD